MLTQLKDRLLVKTVFGDVSSLEGREVTVAGWVYNKRAHGNLLFIDLRDGTGIIQVSAHKDKVAKKVFEDVEKATRESSVIIKGVVRSDKRAPGGCEIGLTDFQIVGLAEEWPLPIDAGIDVLFDKRHLHLRGEKQTAIIKIRASVFEAIREWFKQDGWIEVQPPMIISASVEGGSTLFKMDYFGEVAYLTQSSQFYLEAMIQSMERVYCLAPSFRAEKSKTPRHLAEYWHAEAEAAWMELDDILGVEERLVSHVCQFVAEKHEKDLGKLGRDPAEIADVKAPFERISYREAIERIKKKGVKIEYGDDMGADEELRLTEDLLKPMFVVEYPRSLKPFYHYPKPSDPSIVMCADCEAPEGYGEIIGGGQRIHDKDALIQRIEEEHLKPEDYEWYIDLRRYGTVPHSGFGLGVDRLVRWICRLDHIRASIPFPRYLTRRYP
ncbi:MAG: asparagine--tRNA ligase [Promethearchaeati archaeon SRVP18_Atabeyarchaeia-1]